MYSAHVDPFHLTPPHSRNNNTSIDRVTGHLVFPPEIWQKTQKWPIIRPLLIRRGVATPPPKGDSQVGLICLPWRNQLTTSCRGKTLDNSITIFILTSKIEVQRVTPN